MPPRIELVGLKFSKLQVISLDTTKSRPAYLCQCDCGSKLIVAGANLRKNHTKSCGCLKKYLAAQRATKHGSSGSYLYTLWAGIKQRCLNTEHPSYPDYGGRGIKMCSTWNEYKTFEKDVIKAIGHRPSNKYSLDRINNNKHYEINNIQWSTRKEQVINTRKRLTVRHRDFAQFCEFTGANIEKLKQWKQ